MNKPIPADEVQFHPTSYCDRNGRVFTWRGELYRAITPEGAPLFQRLFDEGIVDQLVRAGLLIESEMTDLSLTGFAFVVHHRRLPFVTYPFEWTAAMLRDAVVLVAQFEIELAAHGLTLQDRDANVWNVLFDATSPRYIDLGSITTLDGWLADKGLDDFLESSVNPLRLLLSPHRRMGRTLMHDYEYGVGTEDVAAIFGKAVRTSPLEKMLKPFKARASSAVRRLRAKPTPSNNSRRLAALRRLIEELQRVPFAETPELEIRQHSCQQSAQRILAKLPARSLLVAGRANREFADTFAGGGFSSRATRLGWARIPARRNRPAATSCLSSWIFVTRLRHLEPVITSWQRRAIVWRAMLSWRSAVRRCSLNVTFSRSRKSPAPSPITHSAGCSSMRHRQRTRRTRRCLRTRNR